MNILKNYDNLLSIKKQLDGSIIIYRQSPFNNQRQHTILTIRNEYCGSFKWVLKKLMLMDTQKYDIAGAVLENNTAVKRVDNRNMHREIATLVKDNEKFIN